MQYPLTAVSGYWKIPNKHGNAFMDWFKTCLRINCPYVFFGTAETIAIAKTFRADLPTHYIELALTDFYMQRYYDDIVTHPAHCPSKELNMIWNEKLFLIQRAAALNPFGSDFFSWIDAGICTYRGKMPPEAPFPNPAKLVGLPTDKLIFTSSIERIFNPHAITKSAYHHYVSGTYVIHRTFIDRIVEQFAKYLQKSLPMRCNIFTDQVILTYMYKDYPGLFHKLGHGYGELLPLLY